ncbi:MBL fold metallo-hydrolase [Paractinoplanes atraurantiacus]|uniref:Glyoxylase, beta-lactamase superfamily II n=1 Tax=Paractinoplanes atraurantiacus TaxID=1036182 RepID=A0A285JKT7_9ACTN|nr:MBL fold metallo-hydrolase [Actinoplanes atraurantiacus]SNY60885.1 Glyoxylase, beta-lactamase superfamily II [Actinoplanes atraurantiacus]
MIVTGTAQHRAWQERVLPPVEQVRPGLWSIPVPIPDNPLRYTLSYAFTGEDDGVLLIDPGWDSAEGRAALTAGLLTAGAAIGEVTGVVVTHVHPDHHGLSGWLRAQGAWIGMHPAEAATLPSRLWSDRRPSQDRDWLRRHGVPPADAERLAITPERMRGLLAMAEPDRLVEDGDLLPLTGRSVRAVWTPGHTPGHLCLHDAEAGLLLTGDHLLPRISPTVAVHPRDEGDPLSAYLESLEQTGKFAAEEALPAHEYRFRGIDSRAAAMIGHHDDRNREILRALDAQGTATAWQIAAALTWSRGWASLRGLMRRMALGETLAHLHHLTTVGAVRQAAEEPTRWART